MGAVAVLGEIWEVVISRVGWAPVLGTVAFPGMAAGSGGHQRVGIVEDGPVGAGDLLGRPASRPRWRTGVAESGALLTGVVLPGAVAAGAVLAASEPLGPLGVVLLAGGRGGPVVLAGGVGDGLAQVALPTAPPPRVVPWSACRGHRAAGSAGPDQGRDRQQRRGVAAAEDHRRALAGQPACLSGAAGSTWRRLCPVFRGETDETQRQVVTALPAPVKPCPETAMSSICRDRTRAWITPVVPGCLVPPDA
jgi:hypothetical protein